MIKRKKVLIFHPALAPYRIDLFNKLDNFFDASFYFMLDNLKDQKFDKKKLWNEINFKFNLIKSGFEFKSQSIRFGILKIIRKYKPDVILCSEYSYITFVVVFYKLFFKHKLYIYILSDDSIKYSLERKGPRKWVRKAMSYIIDGIILPSNIVCNWYLREVNDKTNTFELPIIHSNDIFRKKTENTLNLSAKYVKTHNLTGKKVFIFVGRLVKLKNIDFLIKAFKNVKCKNKMLFIIGKGEENDELQQLTKRLHLTGNCKFLGRLEGDELIAWYNIAQCLILPSLREAYGAVVNEALLVGCKVLCSNYAGASVLINKKNGFIFNPKDEVQLTHQIQNIALNIEPIKLPLSLKPDLMPFTLDEKLEILLPQL